jgi:hypothetical protein
MLVAALAMFTFVAMGEDQHPQSAAGPLAVLSGSGGRAHEARSWLSTPGPSNAAIVSAPVADRDTPPGEPASISRVSMGDKQPQRDLRPDRIRIGALGLDRRLIPLRVLRNGSLAAPRRYSDIGWWRDGPQPGVGGNTVVVGHVDSKTGPAVFYGLASLRPGASITVGRRDGSLLRFRVKTVRRFPVEQFPANRVYRRNGAPRLVLITCGGRYDRSTGRYTDNVVVFADLVDHPPRGNREGAPQHPGKRRRGAPPGSGQVIAGGSPGASTQSRPQARLR